MYAFTTFMPKRYAELITVHPDSDKTILISINSPLTTPGSTAQQLNKDAWADILYLSFHDADEVHQSLDDRVADIDSNKIELFNKTHANQIFDFLKKHEVDCTQVIVHCEAGISRSAAVSKFIADIYALDFPGGYSLYNKLVYSTLMKEFNAAMYGE